MQINPFKLGGGALVVAVLAASVLSHNAGNEQRTAPVIPAPAAVATPVAVAPATTTASPSVKPVTEALPQTAMPMTVRQPTPPKPAYEPPKAQPGLLPPGVAQGTTFNGRPIAAQQQPAELRDAQRANGGRVFDVPDRR